MLRFIARRLIAILITLVAVSAISLAMMHYVKGGPFDQEKKIDPVILKNLNAHYGLDQPIWVQYWRWLKAIVLHGDMGPTLRHPGRSVNDFIGAGLPVSLELSAVALVIAVLAGLAAGVIGAVYRGRWPDKLVMSAALGGLCIPNFVLAPLLILIFALTLQWLPAARFLSFRHIILPSIALATSYIAYVARLVRTGLVETVHLDFVRTARAKGLRERVVVLRHALPLGLLPVLSFIGPAAAGLVTGSLVIERIFNIPGVGRYFVDAAFNRDIYLAQGIVLVDATLLMGMNLLVDLMYRVIDPRVRLGSE